MSDHWTLSAEPRKLSRKECKCRGDNGTSKAKANAVATAAAKEEFSLWMTSKEVEVAAARVGSREEARARAGEDPQEGGPIIGDNKVLGMGRVAALANKIIVHGGGSKSKNLPSSRRSSRVIMMNQLAELVPFFSRGYLQCI